jgi:hypothetical protein
VRALKWLLIVMGILLGLGALAMVAMFAFVFSIGTASRTLLVETTVRDRTTRAPVPGCLLAFEKGTLFMTSGDGQSTQRTDAQGGVLFQKSFQYGSSLFLEPFRRDRHPTLRFYLGEAPSYGTFTRAEAWDVDLVFREPFRKPADVIPRVTLRRGMAHEEVLNPPPGQKWQLAGSDPLPGSTDGRLESVVRVERDGITVRLMVFLDADQARACQAPVRLEIQRQAVQLYNSHRYQEALIAFRTESLLAADPAWAHSSAGDCLIGLNRQKEAIEEHRQALVLAPQRPDIVYGYANSLIGMHDQESVTQFEKLVALEPRAARGYIGRGNALANLERWGASAKALEKAAQLCATCLDAGDRDLLRDARANTRRR